MYEERKRMDTDGSSRLEKSKFSQQMSATRVTIAKEAIEAAGKQLQTTVTRGKSKGRTPGLRLREKLDTDKDSARMLITDLVGKEGTRAIYHEVKTAYRYMVDKKGLKMHKPFASGGSTAYCYFFFRNDRGDEPTMMADMSQVGSEREFPTVGLYSRKHFYPLPLYTLYLQHIVWKGVALAVQGQALPYMRANFLISYAGTKRKQYNDGSLHGDFDVRRQYEWDRKGHPLTNILCISGQTNLRFSTVSRAKDHGNYKQKKDTYTTLEPGDSVWFGWRQYHASHVPEGLLYIPINERLQCMVSSVPDDVSGSQEDEVTLHSNPGNKKLHAKSKDDILHPKKKKKA